MDLARVLLPRFSAASCKAGNWTMQSNLAVRWFCRIVSHDRRRATSALLFIAPSLETRTGTNAREVSSWRKPKPIISLCPSSLLDWTFFLIFSSWCKQVSGRQSTPSPPPSTDINQQAYLSAFGSNIRSLISPSKLNSAAKKCLSPAAASVFCAPPTGAFHKARGSPKTVGLSP